MENDQYYIEKTFELARHGSGSVSPNPLVGAVIVKNGKIIGTGFHSFSGGPHAEVAAFKNCSEDPEGATLYCNLEPCCHTHKKTPPCVPLIISKKIKKVVIANIDPNPAVSGLGIGQLQESGIEVLSGVLKDQGVDLNRFFFKYIRTQVPFVTVKVAQTLDGKICLENGNSKWISNENSRKSVHEMRFEHDAICVGVNTVLNDNPLLNVRNSLGENIKNPYKIIIGNPNKLNSELNIFKLAREKTYIFYHSNDVSHSHAQSLGGQLVKLPKENFEENILRSLGEMNITSLFIEGGEKTISSFLNKKLVDKLIIYIAPKVFGQGKSFYNVDQNVLENFKLTRLENISGDILSEYSLS